MRSQKEIDLLKEVQELSDRYMGGVIDRNAWAQLMQDLKAERIGDADPRYFPRSYW